MCRLDTMYALILSSSASKGSVVVVQHARKALVLRDLYWARGLPGVARRPLLRRADPIRHAPHALLVRDGGDGRDRDVTVNAVERPSDLRHPSARVSPKS